MRNLSQSRRAFWWGIALFVLTDLGILSQRITLRGSTKVLGPVVMAVAAFSMYIGGVDAGVRRSRVASTVAALFLSFILSLHLAAVGPGQAIGAHYEQLQHLLNPGLKVILGISLLISSVVLAVLFYFRHIWMHRLGGAVKPGDRTVLHDAAESGELDQVMKLLADGSGVNARTGNGFTSLALAALHGHCRVVLALLAASADVGLANAKGDTALHCAAEAGAADVAELLISSGAVVDARGNMGDTPLHIAALHGHESFVRTLLKYGATPELRDDKGWNAQKCGERSGNPSVVAILRAVDRQKPVAPHPTGGITTSGNYSARRRLFVSYRSTQSERARQVVDQLTSSGCDIWFAEYETFDPLLREDRHWVNEMISEGVQSSTWGLVFVSKDYLESTICEEELDALCRHLDRRAKRKVVCPGQAAVWLVMGRPMRA
jgi:hypothetical protein